MPFGSYHGTVSEGVANAVRFVKEAGAEAVDELIEIGLGHAGHSHDQRPDGLLGNPPLEALETLARKHGLELMRRPWQQHNGCAGLIDPLSGSGATVVGQDLGALDDESLALVHLRHFAAHLAETLLQNNMP